MSSAAERKQAGNTLAICADGYLSHLDKNSCSPALHGDGLWITKQLASTVFGGSDSKKRLPQDPSWFYVAPVMPSD